jgi:outer membrane protein assembly factor BamE (lipoprotein component of BamABCDE complex)
MRVGIVALLLLTSCATSASKIDQIHIGMTRAKVIEIMGDPVFTEGKENHETLVFNLSESRVSEAAFGGVMRGLNIGKNHYRVELVDGKVTAYFRAEGR